MTDGRSGSPRRGRTILARVSVAVIAILLIVGTVALGRETPAVTAADAATGATAGSITVYDAYVREPANDDVAAAYFSVRNLLLRFESAGDLLVSAPVIPIGAEPPGGR